MGRHPHTYIYLLMALARLIAKKDPSVKGGKWCTLGLKMEDGTFKGSALEPYIIILD